MGENLTRIQTRADRIFRMVWNNYFNSTIMEKAIRNTSSIEVDWEVILEHHIGLFAEKQFLNLKSISSTLVYKAYIHSIAKYPTSKVYFSEKYATRNEEWEKIIFSQVWLLWILRQEFSSTRY